MGRPSRTAADVARCLELRRKPMAIDDIAAELKCTHQYVSRTLHAHMPDAESEAIARLLKSRARISMTGTSGTRTRKERPLADTDAYRLAFCVPWTPAAD
jgi:hypothetical protein